MAYYRRRLMALASVDAEIRNEFWDLMSQIENGSRRAEIRAAHGKVSITRRESDGATMRIELVGGWKALIVETAPHGGIVMRARADFEQVVDEIKARERLRARKS